MNMILHAMEHSFMDVLKMIPFIFFVYLIIEYLEHKHNTEISHILMRSRKAGALYGALLGSVPQCGFSVVASDLFSQKAITAGTLLAVFLATSDEAVPILIMYPERAGEVIVVVGIKILIAIVCGLLLDTFYHAKAETNICMKEDEHEHFHGNCENCEGGILKSAVVHTVKIFLLVFLASFTITLLVEIIGEERLTSYLLKDSYMQPFLTALVGLIPNCCTSVILTQAYISGTLSFGSLIAGLSSGAGVGLLVLFRRNKNRRENIMIVTLLFLIGAFSGVLLQLL